MNIPYFHVDAFTDRIFGGNPAGVCLLESWPEDSLLLHIAAENSLSETAFVVRGRENFALRWFTPVMEVDLCGHATLAAAFVLAATENTISWPIRFASKSGILSVDKRNALFVMDFPSRPAVACAMPDALIRGLGASPRTVYLSRDYLCVFDEEEQIAGLSPDFDALAGLDCLGVIATAPGGEADFVSRFFAPRAGIPEDPVTGSSHCTLVPYWAGRTGKQCFTARQLSSRGGELYCEYHGERVLIGGTAVLYHSATLAL
jgi:predicted PhzF superfamily epimerase YddE/YHI9